MTGRELSDEERAKLKKDLTQGTALISEGMLLLSRVKDLLGQTSVETNEYQEALKVARMKKGELQ